MQVVERLSVLKMEYTIRVSIHLNLLRSRLWERHERIYPLSATYGLNSRVRHAL